LESGHLLEERQGKSAVRGGEDLSEPAGVAAAEVFGGFGGFGEGHAAA
jgi:hypothetical protein